MDVPKVVECRDVQGQHTMAEERAEDIAGPNSREWKSLELPFGFWRRWPLGKPGFEFVAVEAGRDTR